MDSLFDNLIMGELPNKLKIWLKKQEGTNLISLRLAIMTGSAHQDIKNLGLAHFVEHLVFNFTKENHSIRQLYREIEESGGYINAVTGLSSTLMTADIPKEKIDICLELIQECFSYPDFSDKIIKNERKVILNELQNDPNNFWFWIYRNIFGKYPFAYSSIGNFKTIKDINRKKIEDFFHKNYVANKMILICVGGIEFEDLKTKVELKLNRLQNNSEKIKTYYFPKVKNKLIKINSFFAKRTFLYGFRVCGYLNNQKDYFTLWIIRDYLYKILFDFIREKGLVYEIYVTYYPFNLAGIFYIYVSYMKKGLRQLRKKVKEEISNFKNNMMNEAELNKIKNYTINQFINFLRDSKELANYYVSLTESFDEGQEFKNPIEELNALTPLEIQQISNRYFSKNKSFIFVNPEFKDALVFSILLFAVPTIIYLLISIFLK